MIRFLRITPQHLAAWLVRTPVPAPPAPRRYRLRVWREVNASFAGLRDELIAYAQEALDDARKRIRKGFEDHLSPFSDPADDPAANYPAMLNRITLQGYFGETLAGLAVEHFGAFGKTDWHVPAFLFRMHEAEFQHLDLINERLAMGKMHDPDAVKERRPGRTGDDAIAFRIDDQGRITHVLTLEAKCLARSNAATIAEAHGKLSSGQLKPPGVRELISLLSEYDTEEAKEWRLRLLEYYFKDVAAAKRWDGLCYAVGNRPKVPATRVAWLPHDAPHAGYTSTRLLEAMEVQFEDLDGVVDALYRGR
jgi:hypothetical protein